MAIRRTRSVTNNISENGVSFFSSGGHSHNGTNSSLIQTSAYSIYDFNPSFVGDNPERRRAQVDNFNSFKQLIVNTVNSSVLEPAGVVLQDNIINSRNIISGSITSVEIAANTITADNIAAGTITADELAANVILVNNVIRSNNYVQGESGWIIDGDGNAEFYTASIVGYIGATSGTIGGFEIDLLNISSGSFYDGTMVIGPAYGPSNSGAVHIEATYEAGVTQYATYSGHGTEYGLFVNNPVSAPYQTLDIDFGGVRYQYGTERFEFRFDSGVLYAYVDGVPYCISECGSEPPATVVTEPVVVGVVGGGCSTCVTSGDQYALAADCGGGGCFQIWQNYVCGDGCTCPSGCPPVMISDCTGPGCGAVPPSFFSPPSFFAPPVFFAPPAFK